MNNFNVITSHDLKSNITDSKIRVDSSDKAGYPFFPHVIRKLTHFKVLLYTENTS